VRDVDPARRRRALRPPPAARSSCGSRSRATLPGSSSAVLVSRHPHTQTIVTLPAHSSAIVVLDVSASISADTYSRIGATLSSLARSDGRYGLVVFSDQAYEALPPGTPASDLQPLVRYYTLPPAHGGFARRSRRTRGRRPSARGRRSRPGSSSPTASPSRTSCASRS
jgi:hypothetical protein